MGGRIIAVCAAAMLVFFSPARADDLTPGVKVAASGGPISTADVRYGFVPNDPYFHKNTPAAGWPGQWHLVNEHVAGRDAGVQGAWNRNLTGSGVIIGIVDDCLETTHPDLQPNYVAADSWDFGQGDGTPDPVHSDDRHGISVAGVAAARGNNSIGGTGAAPNAGLAGLRIDWPNQTTQMFTDAVLYHSSGANTAIKVKNHSYGTSSPYSSRLAERNALITSTSAGTIHVYAAGNDRGTSGQDVNKKDRQNTPYSVTVAALGNDGMYANYSNFGASIFVTAPSNDSGGFGITTTDRTGNSGYNRSGIGDGDSFPDTDYTSVFGGTSSAAPLVSGVMALGKEAQANLDTRFAKHLLAKTSRVVDGSDATEQSDGGWRTNAAGLNFNQNYGFGLIDADAFTDMADDYTGVSALTTESTGSVAVGAALPDNDPNGVTRTFALTDTDPLEEVLVHLDVTHEWRGDLEAYITSPSGYTSRLMIRSVSDSSDNIDWTFSTNAFWGEDPSGTWSLTVSDKIVDDLGTWNSYEVTTRMGQLVPEPATLSLLALGGLALIRRKRHCGR